MGLKVLIFYTTKNSGHYKAAQAIEVALKQKSNDIEVFNIDCLNYTNPVISKIAYSSYLSLIKRKPEVWEYLYDNPKVVKKVHKFKEIIHKHSSPKLHLMIEEYRPDVIVCTQAFPCGLVADYKNSYSSNIPLIAVLTDYYPHSFWLHSEVDIYIVACEGAKMRLIKEGVPDDKIKIYGIPVNPKFFNESPSGHIRQKLDIDKNIPVVLVMGGSQGFGPLKKIVFSLDQVSLDFYIVISTGFNEKLNKYLNKRKNTFSHRLKVCGYEDNMDELMQISNVLVTKPGGLTTAEAISKKIPMVIFNPIPGQEKNNTKFLLDRGIALKASDSEEVAILVKELLVNKDKYTQMKDLLGKNSFYNPASKTADVVYDLAGMRI